MPQHRVFDNRSGKESFKRRRKALLGSAENLLQDGAQVYIIVRQLDTVYAYNSEVSQAWLLSKQDQVFPNNPSLWRHSKLIMDRYAHFTNPGKTAKTAMKVPYEAAT